MTDLGLDAVLFSYSTALSSSFTMSESHHVTTPSQNPANGYDVLYVQSVVLR